MKTLVIVTHPSYDESRINKRWVDELEKYEEVTINNINEKYSDGQIDKKREQELLLAHDRIVFQYPWYWYNVPAILRNWQDLVLEYGWAFGPGGTALKGKDYIVATSIGGPEVSYQVGNYNNYSISEYLKPMEQIGRYTGMNVLPFYSVYSALELSDTELDKSANDYVRYILNEELGQEKVINEIQEPDTLLLGNDVTDEKKEILELFKNYYNMLDNNADSEGFKEIFNFNKLNMTTFGNVKLNNYEQFDEWFSSVKTAFFDRKHATEDIQIEKLNDTQFSIRVQVTFQARSWEIGEPESNLLVSNNWSKCTVEKDDDGKFKFIMFKNE